MHARALQAIYYADAAIEDATFLSGADNPECVALIARCQDAQALAERAYREDSLYEVFGAVRHVLRLLRIHAQRCERS